MTMSAVVSLGYGFEKPIPDTCLTPSQRSDCSRSSAGHIVRVFSAQGEPVRNRHQDCRSKSAGHRPAGTPRGLLGSSGAIDRPFPVSQFVAAFASSKGPPPSPPRSQPLNHPSHQMPSRFMSLRPRASFRRRSIHHTIWRSNFLSRFCICPNND